MALFSRGLYNADPSFAPLFRLLNDFDAYSREVQGDQEPGTVSHNKHRSQTPFITPKFDLHETKDNFHLYGELPGFAKEDLSVEFPEPQTVVVRGKIERTYSAGTPPADLIQNGKKTKGITEGGEENGSHHATVEDEQAAAAKENAATEVVEHKEQKKTPAAEPLEKFWVTERSFGRFERTFNLPSRVDTNQVSASLKNGVLNIIIPKAKKQEARSITIN